MRRLTSLFTLTALLLIVLGGPATAQDKKAKKDKKAAKKAPAAKKIFPDAKLQAVITAILKKKQAKTDPIKEADLKTIFFLEAPGLSLIHI